MFKRIVPLAVALALLLPCLLVPASAVFVDEDGNVAYTLDDVAAFITETDTTIEVSIDPDVMRVGVDIDSSFSDYPLYWCSLFGGEYWPYYQQISPGVSGFVMSPSSPCYFVDISTFPSSTTLSVDVSLFYPSGDLIEDAASEILSYVRYADVITDLSNCVPFEGIYSEWFDGKWHLDVALDYSRKYVDFMFLVEGDTRFEYSPYVEAKIVFQKADIADNSEVLDAIDKIEQKLDDIVNMPVNPKPPAGADNVTNAGQKEDQLLNSGAAGREEFNNMLGGSAASLELYTSSFAFLSACINPIIDIPWIKEILTISLGLGLTGFLLNLGISAISKAGKDGGKSSGKGGGK